MKESLKTLVSSLGGLTATAAVELIPKIKKKKETGERTRDKMLKHRAGLGKDINTYCIGGKTNAKSSL